MVSCPLPRSAPPYLCSHVIDESKSPGCTTRREQSPVCSEGGQEILIMGSSALLFTEYLTHPPHLMRNQVPSSLGRQLESPLRCLVEVQRLWVMHSSSLPGLCVALPGNLMSVICPTPPRYQGAWGRMTLQP